MPRRVEGEGVSGPAISARGHVKTISKRAQRTLAFHTVLKTEMEELRAHRSLVSTCAHIGVPQTQRQIQSQLQNQSPTYLTPTSAL